MCRQNIDVGGASSLALVLFQFEAEEISLGVDPDSDELFWRNTGDEPLHDLRDTIPSVADAYGLALTWSWEMRNHQGYFDAVQLEFVDPTLSNAVTFQFKAAASAIRVFRVEQMIIGDRPEWR